MKEFAQMILDIVLEVIKGTVSILIILFIVCLLASVAIGLIVGMIIFLCQAELLKAFLSLMGLIVYIVALIAIYERI